MQPTVFGKSNQSDCPEPLKSHLPSHIRQPATSDLSDLQRRQEALRQLAQGQNLTTASPLDTANTRTSQSAYKGYPAAARIFLRFRRTWLFAASIIVLAAVISVSIYSHASVPQSTRTSSRPFVAITPASDSIDCPTDLAWSSNQSLIAVVGYATACPSPDTVYGAAFHDVASALYQGPLVRGGAGHVAVYDAHEGTRVAAFSPDSAILTDMRKQKLITPSFTAWLGTAGISPDQYLAISYTHVLWIPDQQRLIIVFSCYVPDGPPTTTDNGAAFTGHIVQGLDLVGVHGNDQQVMLQPGGSLSAGTTIWNLNSAEAITTLMASAPFSLQPPALSYSWDSNGKLVSGIPVSSRSAPTVSASTAVGAPQSGSEAFTMWQPGIVATSISSREPGVQDLQGVAVFVTNTVALSPDGRYLATSLGLAGLLTSTSNDASQETLPGNVSSAALTQYGWQTAPLLPMRDASLSHALALADQNGFAVDASSELKGFVRVAWSPDGREFAVSADTVDHALTLYDCASGKQLKTLAPPPVTASSANATTSLIEWSANGNQLAYYDSNSGVLTLWGPAALPT